MRPELMRPELMRPELMRPNPLSLESLSPESLRPELLGPELFDALLAEQAAQRQVLLMALRWMAEVTRSAGQDPEDLRDWWTEDGHAALDRASLRAAPGHEASWRLRAKAQLDEILAEGLR